MTLPTSGALSMSMFNTEFGLGYSFSAYRGKGSAPASGAMSFSQLYGASNIIREPPTGEYYTPGSYEWNGAVIKWAGAIIALVNNPPYTKDGWTYYKGSKKSTANGGIYAIYRIKA